LRLRRIERVQHLDGHRTADPEVLAAVNRTHPAGPDTLVDTVPVRDDLADERIGGGHVLVTEYPSLTRPSHFAPPSALALLPRPHPIGEKALQIVELQVRVPFALAGESARGLAGIVVPWVKARLAGHLGQRGIERAVHLLGIATGQIASSTALDEEGIPR